VRLVLKEFQEEKVDELVDRLRRAARDAKTGELQAVVLSSPTGSGKTVMATSAIERLIQGDDRAGPRREARFMWISDQPELNEQTRRKMLDASSILGSSKLVVVDAAFDREEFAPGIVHFLNIQKLGKEKTLISSGDKRTYTLWDTVSNTAKKHPGDFFVFIDEAHRGMFESATTRQQATTIIQRFIKGWQQLDSVPLIAGISATPDRFQKLVEGSNRTVRHIEVPVEAVRASGLLKDVLAVYRPTAKQPTDRTMLVEAAKRWRLFASSWANYTSQSGDMPVKPILVVQVEDAAGRRISKTDLADAIGAIQDAVGPLPPESFAHSFQEGGRLSLDEIELRYLAPSDIESDAEVQVVFFKTSLSTGWDCPRAEVMMSFRRAVDATYIAQLVGRMVRSPLARRIDLNEFLNTVALYLPHYDETGLERVVKNLTAPDPEMLPAVEIRMGQDLLTLHRRTRSGAAFEALGRVPSYVIPAARPVSQVRRLMKFARLLSNEDIDEDAPDKAVEVLMSLFRSVHRRRARTKRFKDIVQRSGRVEIDVDLVSLWQEEIPEAESTVIDLEDADVDEVFEAAGRKVGEGLHKTWWRERVASTPASKGTAKLEFFALVTEPQTVEQLENKAQQTVQRWMRSYATRVDSLSGPGAETLEEIQQLAVEPEQLSIQFPEVIETRRGSRAYDKHLYVDDTGKFTATLNKWEAKALEPELKRREVVGWIRNMDRKKWSFRVPYELDGRYRALYPDFLLVRRSSSRLVVDVLDPHSLELADAPQKAAGLAKFAAKHAPAFGRIQLIIVDDDRIHALELTDERVRKRVAGVKTHEALKDIFATTRR
jgi:type III restriction enzyme